MISTHSLSNTKIGVIGLGYVGLPLAVEFGKKRDVIGFDVDARRIEALKAGQELDARSVRRRDSCRKALAFHARAG